MLNPAVLKIEVLDESGFPLIVYDFRRHEIDKEALLSDKKVLKSSLLVAAVHGLSEDGSLTNIIDMGKEKFLVLKRKEIIVVLSLSPHVDPSSEKIQLFARSLLYGIMKLHERMGINPTDIPLQEYLDKIDEPFRKLVKNLIIRVGLQ